MNNKTAQRNFEIREERQRVDASFTFIEKKLEQVQGELNRLDDMENYDQTASQAGRTAMMYKVAQEILSTLGAWLSPEQASDLDLRGALEERELQESVDEAEAARRQRIAGALSSRDMHNLEIVVSRHNVKHGRDVGIRQMRNLLDAGLVKSVVGVGARGARSTWYEITERGQAVANIVAEGI